MPTPERDHVRTFLFDDTNVQGQIVQLAATVQSALARAGYPPTIERIVGEALAAAALLGSSIQQGGSLLLQAEGSGPLQFLSARLSGDGTLRALARHSSDPQEGDLREIFGSGHLAITIDSGQDSKRQQGIVPLEGRSLSEAIELYFRRSEQVGARLWLTCAKRRAAGLLVQRRPEGSSDPDAWDRVVHLASSIRSEELLALPDLEILRRLFHAEQTRVFEPRAIRFGCSCSRERIEPILRAIGVTEVRTLIEGRGQIEVDCEFCGERYVFDAIDAESLFSATARTTPTPQ